MQETRPTDNQEPSSKEAADVDAGIASGVEIVSDKLLPPPKEPSGSILSSGQQTSNAAILRSRCKRPGQQIIMSQALRRLPT
jgi:hypothetical protein